MGKKSLWMVDGQWVTGDSMRADDHRWWAMKSLEEITGSVPLPFWRLMSGYD